MKKDLHFQAQKMQYQVNSLSYSLMMLSLIASILAMFTLITYDSFGGDVGAIRVIPDLRIGLEIGVGIVMLLVTFLAAEKVKFYNPLWSTVVVFGLAAVNFWRMNSFPIYVYTEMHWVPRNVAVNGMIEFGVAGGLMILAGVIATIKVIIIRKYAKETTR